MSKQLLQKVRSATSSLSGESLRCDESNGRVEEVCTLQHKTSLGTPKTAPGGLATFMLERDERLKELAELHAAHARFVDADPARDLDPRSIRPSRWMRPLDFSLNRNRYSQLKISIELANGNVQPIKVRPVESETSPEGAEGSPAQFELVFGHLRHRACLELGLSVAAVISEVSDQDLVVEMTAENRTHGHLSLYEYGVTFQRVLQDGLFASERSLAQALGRDLRWVSKALKVGELPLEVVEAFDAPKHIRWSWVEPLLKACFAQPEAIRMQARRLRDNAGVLSAHDVYTHLVGASDGTRASPSSNAA